MKLLELIKILIANKETILEIIEFIRSLFPTDDGVAIPVSADAVTKFPALAAQCETEGITLEELATEIKKQVQENK